MNNTVTLKGFNLNMFGEILSQSIMVTPQMMLEFKNEMVKSVSLSVTKSLIKLVTFPIKDMIEDFDTKPQDLSGFNFDFYILRGEAFLKYISVFGKDPVDLVFTLIDGDDSSNDKMQATSLKISGYSENGSKLAVEFQLTTSELISDKISDFSELINIISPSTDMSEFQINTSQSTEIKGLVKKLHNSIDNNTSFLTFKLDDKNVSVSDKAFKSDFENTQPEKFKGEETISFNILKNDFVLIGDHTFSLFTSYDAPKVILGTKFKKSIIWVMSSKVEQDTEETYDEAVDLSSFGFDD